MNRSDASHEPEEAQADDARPRVLSVRFGANPNSSSLGVDVTYLLFGGTGALAIAMGISAFLRLRRKKAEVVGTSDPKSAP